MMGRRSQLDYSSSADRDNRFNPLQRRMKRGRPKSWLFAVVTIIYSLCSPDAIIASSTGSSGTSGTSAARSGINSSSVPRKPPPPPPLPKRDGDKEQQEEEEGQAVQTKRKLPPRPPPRPPPKQQQTNREETESSTSQPENTKQRRMFSPPPRPPLPDSKDITKKVSTRAYASAAENTQLEGSDTSSSAVPSSRQQPEFHVWQKGDEAETKTTTARASVPAKRDQGTQTEPVSSSRITQGTQTDSVVEQRDGEPSVKNHGFQSEKTVTMEQQPAVRTSLSNGETYEFRLEAKDSDVIEAPTDTVRSTLEASMQKQQRPLVPPVPTSSEISSSKGRPTDRDDSSASHRLPPPPPREMNIARPPLPQQQMTEVKQRRGYHPAPPGQNFQQQHAIPPLQRDVGPQYPSNVQQPHRIPYQNQHQQQYYSQHHQPHPQRQPPPVKRQQQQQHSTLKSLWRRIEKGLDGLADMEEAVTDRAQQLYSSTVSSVSSVNKVLPSTVKVPNVKFSVWKKSAAAEQPAPPMDMSRFQKKLPPEANGSGSSAKPSDEGKSGSDSAATSTVRMNPYGFSYPSKPSVASTKTGAGAVTASPKGRAIDWDSVRSGQLHTSRLMRANGGASSPEDQQQDGSIGLVSKVAGATPSQHQLGGATVSYQTQITTASSPPSAASRSFSQRTNQPPISQQQQQQQQRRPAPQGPPARRPYPDEDETTSLASKLARFLPPIPRIRMSNPFRRRGSYDFANSQSLDAWKADEEESMAGKRQGFLGLFGRRNVDAMVPPRSVTASRASTGNRIFTEPMADLMERCREGKAASLLNKTEKESCRAIGRQRAVLDLLFLTFIIVGTRHLPSFNDFRVPHSVVDALTTTVTDTFSLLAASTETWAPFAFVAAFLAMKTRSVLCDSKTDKLATSVESSILEESQYGSLFLRIVSSRTVDRTIPQKMQAATRAQILSKVDVARLQAFVALILLSFLFTSAAFLHPLVLEWLGALGRFVSLEQWQTWPPQASAILEGLQSVVRPLWTTATSVVANEFLAIIETPLRSACKLSIFVALYLVAFLPALEGKRRSPAVLKDDEIDEDEDERNMHEKFTEQIVNLGASTATRLDALAVDGRVDRILERWRAMMPRKLESTSDVGLHSVLRLACYGIVSSAVLAAPLVFCGVMGIPMFGSTDSVLPRWDYLFDVAAILIFTQYLVWNALSKTVTAEDVKEKIARFVSSLVEIVEERRKLLDAPPPDLTLKGSFNPTAGITVKDLWASHTTKRAWAIRGASLSCQNGEILVLLGDDGAGKSRLVTTLAESIVSPPRKTMSSQRVRGSISVAGLEVTKWDHNMLKRRLGLFLDDVRSISDTAQMLSGLSLEEILDPCDGLRNLDPSHNPGSAEKSSMMLALKLTGLYSTLLRRLPSKMSTVVTASEEDLNPNPLRPRYHVLSPSEWSKLLLARVLAQAIYDNENSAGTTDAVANSLIGTVLLFDDPTVYLSEVEEGRILKDLRSTGAAIIITSNRWATGRFADKIAVLKDGAIVEFGTHAELLNRGPQQSIYAAKWHGMASNS